MLRKIVNMVIPRLESRNLKKKKTKKISNIVIINHF